MNGHCDVIGGAIVTTTEKLSKEIQFLLNGMDTNASPFDSWLVLSGIKTLPVRMDRHAESSMKIARYLDEHPRVKEVFYPGLPSHPGHEIAKKKQMDAVEWFHLKSRGKSRNSLGNWKYSMVKSLGRADSLVEHAATMSHASMNGEARIKAGITDDLIRLSIGLEDVEDLIGDLEKALG